MSEFDVTQFRNPYEDEPPCKICHQMDCECPECEVCGVAGDPACINVHMDWKKWGHFIFMPTKREREEAEKQMEAEFGSDVEFYDELNKNFKPPTEEELHRYYESFDENNLPPN